MTTKKDREELFDKIAENYKEIYEKIVENNKETTKAISKISNKINLTSAEVESLTEKIQNNENKTEQNSIIILTRETQLKFLIELFENIGKYIIKYLPKVFIVLGTGVILLIAQWIMKLLKVWNVI